MRGFAFHGGSVEGVSGFLASGIDHVDPLAWRALCEQLYAFREAHRDELVHFNFPLLYFTEAELRASVIGADDLVGVMTPEMSPNEAWTVRSSAPSWPMAATAGGVTSVHRARGSSSRCTA